MTSLPHHRQHSASPLLGSVTPLNLIASNLSVRQRSLGGVCQFSAPSSRLPGRLYLDLKMPQVLPDP